MKYHALQLYKRGYRQVSRRYGIVSRVDRKDWREVMAATHVNGMCWVKMLGDESAASYYRACISKDTIEGLDDATMNALRKLVNEGEPKVPIRKFVTIDPMPTLLPKAVDEGVVIYILEPRGCSDPKRFALLTSVNDQGCSKFGFAYCDQGLVVANNLKFTADTMTESIKKAVEAGRSVFWLDNITDIADLK